jgi:L-ascorbate metabolism protein UlaG (beta-lactamase superfamily)
MEITWLGHSCFHIRGEGGISIITDPPDESSGYRIHKIRADVVTISHEHAHHNNLDAILGNPAVQRGPGESISAGIHFKGVETSHDNRGGELRGKNTAFCFDLEGISVCHLGDLGRPLNEGELLEMGSIDLLFVPVGGIQTLDGKGAQKVVEQLDPSVVIPMHFKTDALSFDLQPVDGFLKGKRFEGPEKSITVSESDLYSDKARIVLLEYVSA